MKQAAVNLRDLPSVDEVLQVQAGRLAAERYGWQATVGAVRNILAAARAKASLVTADAAAVQALEGLDRDAVPSLRPVYNLTGTVLHTNLGRALLAEAAIEAATAAMQSAVALEYDVDSGKRGERDDHVRRLLCDLTGAEDATVVNNNAAAVLLVLNTFGKGRESVVSRGELIEIGGAFRMPEIMARAGTKLVEIGTTNRTHKKDYMAAIGKKTGLILKVHTSNYRIQGFTTEVSARDLAALAHEHGIPLVNDLGSGTLADVTRYGLPPEPTVAKAVVEGADLVTFSGDKLLGGPQTGFIVGRKDLIARINRNPMKRALRVDKIRLAALEATLRLYRDPDCLAIKLPTIRLLARSKSEIEALAKDLRSTMEAAVGRQFRVTVMDCHSQIGSGAMPLSTIPSAGLCIEPVQPRSAGRALSTLASALRGLPVPVIGRIEDQRFLLDLRCLENKVDFLANLGKLTLTGSQ